MPQEPLRETKQPDLEARGCTCHEMSSQLARFLHVGLANTGFAALRRFAAACLAQQSDRMMRATLSNMRVMKDCSQLAVPAAQAAEELAAILISLMRLDKANEEVIVLKPWLYAVT